MNTSSLQACALFAGCAVIAACSPTTQLSRLQYTPNAAGMGDLGKSPLRYRVLHAFGAGQDGSVPNRLTRVGDTFYGTTQKGGSEYCAGSYVTCGTFFSITSDGTEKILHNFGKGKDGRNPVARLIYVGGLLYGTTEYGGASNDGTVFSITTGGKEKVLYSFGARPDGEAPTAELKYVRGTLYGTTFAGGTGCALEGCGTVFSVTMNGREKVLHRFGDKEATDGWYPDAGLTYVKGTLYGTTFGGGGVKFGNFGTVFSITTSGKEKVLHRFSGLTNDGWWPTADLLDVKGTLYGTTSGGGAHCGSSGCGTVFSITRGGSEKVLHSFDRPDGAYPEGSLIVVNGTLYGTTEGGGSNSCPHNFAGGCGTIFSITTEGNEKVLRSFQQRTGGNGPVAALVYESGAFYGTTANGGLFGTLDGGGVVFSLTKPGE